MKILLVNPSQNAVYGKKVIIPPAYPPLGLLYIAAMIEKGNNVEILDFDTDDLTKEKFISHLNKFNPDLVGLTASTPMIKNALKAAEWVKENRDVPVVLGGIHATIAPEECISNENIDFILKGEAEKTFEEFVKNFSSRKFKGIKGIWYKENGKVIRNPDRELIKNLDELPFPARHLMKHPEKYIPADALRQPVTTIITTRGCPGKCTYCCTKNIFGSYVRFRSIDNVMKEIKECIDGFGIKEFHIMDDCFTISKRLVMDFRDAIKKSGMDINFVFPNGLRADHVDRDVLTALKDLGVISVGYGVESGNQQILDNIKKGITLKQVRDAFKLSKELGFETWGFFMLGLPGENKNTARDTINFAKELDPDFAKFLILKPYPGSEIYEQLEKSDLILDHDYDKYGVYTGAIHKLPDLSQEEISRLQKKAFREFYLRPKKIIQHIKRIRSFTQLKLNAKSAVFILKRMVFN